MQELDKLNQLTESHGELRPGKGLISGIVALSLAILCFLGVLAFHFPEYLTTPQLRKSYNVDVMRQLLYWSLVISGGIALFNVLFTKVRWLSVGTFVLIGLCLALGGHRVEVDPNFPDGTPYIGLDWFVLDLLGSTLIFVFVEKLFPRDVTVGATHERLEQLKRKRKAQVACSPVPVDGKRISICDGASGHSIEQSGGGAFLRRGS